jgi:hypothetical protein
MRMNFFVMNSGERERETRIYIASNLPAYANKQRGERLLILAVYVSALARVCVRERASSVHLVIYASNC